MIDRVDRDDEKVYVNRSKDEIKDAPEFDNATSRQDGYRDEVGSYYERGPTGSRGPTDIDPV